MTAVYRGLQTAIKGATVAQGVFNAVSTANPWGALLKIIIAAGTALATYAYFAGGAASKQEKLQQKQADIISAKQQEIEMNKQQVELLGTLGNAYAQTQENLEAVQGDQIKTQEIEKTQGVIYKELANIVGEAAAQRIVASEDIKGAITEEQRVHNEKINCFS